MKNGRISESGTYDDLMKNGKDFIELIESNKVKSENPNEKKKTPIARPYSVPRTPLQNLANTCDSARTPPGQVKRSKRTHFVTYPTCTSVYQIISHLLQSPREVIRIGYTNSTDRNVHAVKAFGETSRVYSSCARYPKSDRKVRLKLRFACKRWRETQNAGANREQPSPTSTLIQKLSSRSMTEFSPSMISMNW